MNLRFDYSVVRENEKFVLRLGQPIAIHSAMNTSCLLPKWSIGTWPCQVPVFIYVVSGNPPKVLVFEEIFIPCWNKLSR